MITSAGLMISMGARYRRMLRSQYDPDEVRRQEIGSKLASVLEASARIPFYRDRYGAPPAPDSFPNLPVVIVIKRYWIF